MLWMHIFGGRTSPEAHDKVKHDLLSFCRQISAGLHYLSTKHFVHRDLAARNVLVSSDDVCKVNTVFQLVWLPVCTYICMPFQIADFGMARDVADDIYYVTTGGKIPVKWTAPEVLTAGLMHSVY